MNMFKTYARIDGRMVHDGYFLVTAEYPLKWISLKAFSRLSDANHPALKGIHGLPEEAK